MRFTISREKLQEGLTAVTATIPAKTTLPVLANILVETTERGIRLSGTDLDIAVTTEVAADVESAGAITIPAKKLSEIARALPASNVKNSHSPILHVVKNLDRRLTGSAPHANFPIPSTGRCKIGLGTHGPPSGHARRPRPARPSPRSDARLRRLALDSRTH